jgi:hypothetical protein
LSYFRNVLNSIDTYFIMISNPMLDSLVKFIPEVPCGVDPALLGNREPMTSVAYKPCTNAMKNVLR